MFQLQQRASAPTKLCDHPGSDFNPLQRSSPTNPALNAFPGHLLKLAPVITWPLLVSPKKAKTSSTTKILRLKHILMAKVCSELAQPSWLGGLFGNQPMTKFARRLFACSEFVPSSPGVRSEFVRSLSRVCAEFVRSSEFFRSSFGVRSWFTCGQNPKCAHAGFAAGHCFLCEHLQLQAPNLVKMRAGFGLKNNAFCSCRRGGFIVKLFPKNSSSPFLLAAKTHFCLDDPPTLSARASSCLTQKRRGPLGNKMLDSCFEETGINSTL